MLYPKKFLLSLVIVIGSAAPGFASEDNYNANAAGNSLSNNANCRSALFSGGCEGADAAPFVLPAWAFLASGVLGAIFVTVRARGRK